MQKQYLKTYLNKLSFILIFIFTLIWAEDDNSVYGFVTDSSRGEALIGANVFINELGVGMATDVNGYYVLQEIKSGSYEITVSYIGYQILRKDITISQSTAQKLDLILQEEVVSLMQVEVSAEKIKR